MTRECSEVGTARELVVSLLALVAAPVGGIGGPIMICAPLIVFVSAVWGDPATALEYVGSVGVSIGGLAVTYLTIRLFAELDRISGTADEEMVAAIEDGEVAAFKHIAGDTVSRRTLKEAFQNGASYYDPRKDWQPAGRRENE